MVFIPVRSGNRSTPLRNIKRIRGRPLIHRLVEAACECKYTDKVYVATDSGEIKNVIEKSKSGPYTNNFCKIEVIGRSVESAPGTAPTEYATLEFAETHNFGSVVPIQTTSSLLPNIDLDRGFECFLEARTGSVLSVVRQEYFRRMIDKQGCTHPMSYDVFKRPHHQEFGGYMVENGALYISSKATLFKSRNRVSGNIKAVGMNENTFSEIDEPGDWITIETLMRKSEISALWDIPVIKMFLTDCDGCLTDDGVYYSGNGGEIEEFSICDGIGFVLLKNTGIIIGVIISKNIKLNRKRAEEVKLDILEAGYEDRLSAARILCEERGIASENVAYVDSDISNITLMREMGFNCCPTDAVETVEDVVDRVTDVCGGKRIIREIIENSVGIGFNRNIQVYMWKDEGV